MAKLRKAGQPPAAPPADGFGPGKSAKPCREWQAFAAAWFPELAGRPALRFGDAVLLPPMQGLPQNRLRMVRGGVLAGSLQRGRFVPAHHLFTAFGAGCASRVELSLEDPRTACYLRGEEIEAGRTRDGWCCVLVDGLPLGAGKVSGGRVKNHYPKALRNLK